MASKHNIDIEKVIDMIIDGKTFRDMSKILNISLSTLHDNLSKPEHSARVKNALLISADTYVDMAANIVLEAPNDPVEMQRARIMEQHYRWRASKRRPTDYGDRQTIEHEVSPDAKKRPDWFEEK